MIVFWKKSVVILVQRKTKHKENFVELKASSSHWWQRKCGTISSRVSFLAQSYRARNIENIEDPFHLYFDNDIIDKIVDYIKFWINETTSRSQRSNNFNESSKYRWVKKTDRVEIDALLGLAYFRGILGANTHMTERLLSNEIQFIFGAMMSKTRFRFLKGQICFDSLQERTEPWKTDRFTAVGEIWEIFNSNLSEHVAPL